MTSYLVTVESLINKRRGWNELDDVEEFKAETEQEAIAYFKKKYLPTVHTKDTTTTTNIWNEVPHFKSKKELNVYELQITPAYDDDEDDIKILATIIAE